MDNKILEKLKSGLVFLSMPYSSNDISVEEARYENALKLVNHLMINEIHVISPIITGHPVVERFNTPGDWEFWSSYCEKCIKTCDYVLVYKLEGFDNSKGVEGELNIARDLGKDVLFIDEDFNITEMVDSTEEDYDIYNIGVDDDGLGYFPIDELEGYHLHVLINNYTKNENIEETKIILHAIANSIKMNKKLDWD